MMKMKVNTTTPTTTTKGGCEKQKKTQTQMQKKDDFKCGHGNILASVLDGSFDAGFLVDEATGEILYINQPALELFEAPSAEGFFKTMDDFVSFWSHSLTAKKDGKDDDDDNDDKDKDKDKEDKEDGEKDAERPQTATQTTAKPAATTTATTTPKQTLEDKLSWSEVVKYASGSMPSSSSSSSTTKNTNKNEEKPEPTREWIISGSKMTLIPRTRSSMQLLPPESEEGEEEEAESETAAAAAADTGGEREHSINSSGSAHTSTRPSFPGILKMTPFPSLSNDDCGTQWLDGGGTQWLVYVRHLDAHQIIRTGGSQSGDNSLSRGIRRGASRYSNGSSRTSKNLNGTTYNNNNNNNNNGGPPRLTINDKGLIVDINGPALDGGWDWVTKDLVGKHISAVQTVAPEPPEEGAGRYVNPHDNANNPNNANTNNPNKKPAKKMLDFILENKINPGHVSVPYSGFALRTNEEYNTALTTGNAIREENITEAAFEAALDPIFQINEHGTIQMVNSAATKAFGWEREEFIGSNVSMIAGGGHEARHASYMARYLATGDTRVIGKNRKLVAQRKDGSEFPIELGVVEVDTFAGDVRLFCGFVRDLSDLVARERLAQQIVEVALDPMFQIDKEGTILMVNKAAMTTFGYERDELIGKNVSIICGGSHGTNHDIYLKRYLRTGEKNVIGKYRELPAKRKDGSEFIIQLAVVEIQSEKKTKNHDGRMFCGFVHDLSRQRRDNDIMRGTIDTSLDPVLHINENGIIQMVNNAVIDHLGYTREELVGENVSLIVGGEHQKNHGKYIQRYLETGEKRAMGQKRKLTARRKDGSEMKIELGLSEINISGGSERMFCAFLTDLSKREG
jgi:PAS domain S-box-containing protein